MGTGPKPLAIIAGGTVGLVEAVETRFTAAGFSVAVMSPAVPGESGNSLDVAAPVDFLDPAAVMAWVDEVVNRHGRLDCLVQFSAAASPLAWLDTSLETFDRIIAENMHSAFIVSQCVARAMAARGGGSILHVVDASAGAGEAVNPVHAASQAAILQLVRIMEVDLAAAGIRVNAITTPAIQASWAGGFTTALEAGNAPVVISKGDGLASLDIAGAALFLSTAEASFVNGHILDVSTSRDLLRSNDDYWVSGHGQGPRRNHGQF